MYIYTYIRAATISKKKDLRHRYNAHTNSQKTGQVLGSLLRVFCAGIGIIFVNFSTNPNSNPNSNPNPDQKQIQTN